MEKNSIILLLKYFDYYYIVVVVKIVDCTVGRMILKKLLKNKVGIRSLGSLGSLAGPL